MTYKPVVNRMKLYKIYMDISKIVSLLKKFSLGEFQHPFPIIFIEAKDPDEACHIAYLRFVETILKQNDSEETSKLLQDILFNVRVTRVVNK